MISIHVRGKESLAVAVLNEIIKKSPKLRESGEGEIPGNPARGRERRCYPDDDCQSESLEWERRYREEWKKNRYPR